jgi:hypothetical protein
METIQPFAVSPWEKRIHIIIKPDRQEAAQIARDTQGILVATCSSEKKGIVGMGGAICDTTTTAPPDKAAIATYTATLGPRHRLNIYFAEIIAVATALRNLSALPLKTESSQFSQATYHCYSSSIALANTQDNPTSVRSISQLINFSKQAIRSWPFGRQQMNRSPKRKAKAAARQAAEPWREVQEHSPSAKATVLCRAKQKHEGKLIEEVGEYTRKLDTALPGRHTRLLYNAFKRIEASILAQLRTGMSRLNGYLQCWE